jgi:SAM-dependent methyltransferase
MPDDATLAKMYDSSYCDPDAAVDSGEAHLPDRFDDVIDVISGRPAGLFIDFGCGEGELLRDVKALGWDTLGIDFNPDFASAAVREGITVLPVGAPVERKADVLHLGDVIEHLTDLNTQFPDIVELLKEDGLLIAHGPLEGNPNLFFRCIRGLKKLRGNPRTEMAPFHVILATTDGQEILFERAGLEKVAYRISEIAFPAPETLALKELSNVRNASLYGIRKISKFVTRLGGNKIGNRYFYVGRKHAADGGNEAA